MVTKQLKSILLIGMFLLPLLVGQARADAFLVEVYAGLREEFNDNIFLHHEEEVGDLITTIAAGLEASDRSETLSWNLKGEVAPFFYLENTELNDVDQEYRGGIQSRLSDRWSAGAGAGFQADNRPDRDIEETGQVLNNQTRYRATADANAGFVLSEVQSLSASYAFIMDDWQGEDTANLDYQGHTVNLGIDRDISGTLEATTVIGGLGLGFYDYDDGEISTGYASAGMASMLNEVYRFSARLGARYTETRYQQGTLVLVPPGVYEIQYQDVQNNTWGGIGSLELAYLGERSNASLALSHDLRPAQGSTGPSNLTKATADLNHRLGERLNIGLYAGYFINRAEAGEYVDASMNEETFNLRPRVWWAFGDHLTLSSAYRYTYVTDREYDTYTQRHLVYFQLTYAWPLVGGRNAY